MVEKTMAEIADQKFGGGVTPSIVIAESRGKLALLKRRRRKVPIICVLKGEKERALKGIQRGT